MTKKKCNCQHGGLTPFQAKQIFQPNQVRRMVIKPIKNKRLRGKGYRQHGGNIFDSVGNYFSGLVKNPLRAGLALTTFGTSEIGYGASKLAEKATGIKGSKLLDTALPIITAVAPELIVPTKVVSATGKLIGAGKKRRHYKKKRGRKKKR